MRPSVALYRASRKLQCGLTIPLFRRENLKGLTYMIDSSPRVMRLAIDPNIYLVKVPTPARIRLMTDAALSDLAGKSWNAVFH